MTKERATVSKSADQDRLAVLIDADNAQPSIAQPLFSEIAKLGIASVKRAYGDWTSGRLGKWKEVLNENAIQPVQQFAYTSGKNATDAALIIDAMDLLYGERLQGFCIISSDSDYTRLATRLRESGMMVYGFGEQKTPRAFVSGCDRFIYTEILKAASEGENAPTRSEPQRPVAVQSRPMTVKELRSDSQLVRLLRAAVESSADDEGWARLASVGQRIANQSPDFDPRNYGYTKLRQLIKASELFTEEVFTTRAGRSETFIRDKRW